MIDFAHSGDVQIDRTHNAAIRREIGDRFRIALNAERVPRTPRLASLLEQLAAQGSPRGASETALGLTP